MRVSERDLSHDASSERFGAAISKCEGYTPDCSYSGKCMAEGDCFASPPNLVAARMIEKLLPTNGRAGVHYAYLRKAAEMLREERICL